MSENHISRCSNSAGTVELALDGAGKLWCNGRCFDFNKEYQGYYPTTRFTAIAWTGSGFLAAGQETESGRIVAYSSLRGGVWQPENLMARTPEGMVIPTEQVNDICQDPVSGQIFLVGNKGQVITLNGCPKCVKISFFGSQDIRRGVVEGEYLRLTLADDSSREVHLNAAMQLHLSQEAAEKLLQKGARLIDVSDEAEEDETAAENRAEKSITKRLPDLRIPLTGVNAFLRGLFSANGAEAVGGAETILIFTCTSGIRAEAAAKTARAQGFREAYYMEKKLRESK